MTKLSEPEILILARNTNVVLEAEKLAVPEKWKLLEYKGNHLWGLSLDTQGRVVIQLDAGRDGLSCSCTQHKPCHHIIALFLLFEREPKRFRDAAPPDYVRKSLISKYTQSRPKSVAELRESMQALELWLRNLIRRGLGEAQLASMEFWDEMAYRILAAGMPTLAQWIHEIGILRILEKDWPESVLNEVSRMYLLTRSFERFESLDVPMQADIRNAIGWYLQANELHQAETLEDEWLVIGKQQIQHFDEAWEHKLWLYGRHSQRTALIQQMDSFDLPRLFAYSVGDWLQASLIFEASQNPLRAHVLADNGKLQAENQSIGFSLSESLKAYQTALSRNPWLKDFPFVLRDVYLQRFDKGWSMRHEDGTSLPVSPKARTRWALFALSSEAAIQLNGIWNGQYFHPMSVKSEEQFIDLNQTLKYKASEGKKVHERSK